MRYRPAAEIRSFPPAGGPGGGNGSRLGLPEPQRIADRQSLPGRNWQQISTMRTADGAERRFSRNSFPNPEQTHPIPVVTTEATRQTVKTQLHDRESISGVRLFPQASANGGYVFWEKCWPDQPRVSTARVLRSRALFVVALLFF
jgi:hypothetical protein